MVITGRVKVGNTTVQNVNHYIFVQWNIYLIKSVGDIIQNSISVNNMTTVICKLIIERIEFEGVWCGHLQKFIKCRECKWHSLVSDKPRPPFKWSDTKCTKK